jgi:type I restriction enzyme S subunit
MKLKIWFNNFKNNYNVVKLKSRYTLKKHFNRRPRKILGYKTPAEVFLKYNIGTQNPVIKDEDILNILIPIINNRIQTKIEEKIKESFSLKQNSKELLEVAKKAVEIAIENGENEAMEYINTKA